MLVKSKHPCISIIGTKMRLNILLESKLTCYENENFVERPERKYMYIVTVSIKTGQYLITKVRKYFILKGST